MIIIINIIVPFLILAYDIIMILFIDQGQFWLIGIWLCQYLY